MTKTWTFIGLFKLLVVLVLSVVYRPDLNTGYAADTYAYLAAVAFAAVFSLLPHVLMALKHDQSLALSSPRIVYSLVVLLISWLAVVVYFMLFVWGAESDYQTFWVCSLITVFTVFFLFLVIDRITAIAAESEQTQQLNLARRESFVSQIDDFYHLVPSFAQTQPFEKSLNRLRDEVRLIPSQTSGIDFSRFNAVMSELKQLAQKHSAATEAVDDNACAEQMVRLMDRASVILSSIKSK